MHEGASTREADAFARRLDASGLTAKEIGAVLLVGQSTVSRLLHGGITEMKRHVAVFDAWEGERAAQATLEIALADIVDAARRDPAVRRLVVDLHTFMQNA